MEHKILVAVDITVASHRVVQYVAAMVRHHPEASITLHHVILRRPVETAPEGSNAEGDVATLKEEALRAAEELSAELTAGGVSENRIRIQIQVCDKATSIAPLLLEELRANRYDTLVVGRHDRSKREEFIFGSVSGKIVREAKDCVVWVVQ